MLQLSALELFLSKETSISLVFEIHEGYNYSFNHKSVNSTHSTILPIVLPLSPCRLTLSSMDSHEVNHSTRQFLHLQRRLRPCPIRLDTELGFEPWNLV
jgi:hypothetical protein